MGAKNPYTVSHKALERHTVRATTAVTLGHVVDYVGAQVSTLGAVARGIAIQNAVIGQDFTITTDGSDVAKVGAAVATVGVALTPDAQGRLIPVSAAGQSIFARSLGTAAAADEFIEVQIIREGKN